MNRKTEYVGSSCKNSELNITEVNDQMTVLFYDVVVQLMSFYAWIVDEWSLISKAAVIVHLVYFFHPASLIHYSRYSYKSVTFFTCSITCITFIMVNY